MDNKQNRTKLCLRSISEDTSDQDIREFCEKYGEVKYFKRLENKYTAFVEYATVSQAELAKSKIFRENKMGWRVDLAAPRTTGGSQRDGESSRLDKLHDKRETNGIWTSNMEKEPAEKVTEDEKHFGNHNTSERENVEMQTHVSIEDLPPNVEYQSAKMDGIGQKQPHEEKSMKPDVIKPRNNQRMVFQVSNDEYDRLSEIIEDTSCNFCDGPAYGKCDRCGDYYCSIKCQYKDWKRHRMICFPMPRLSFHMNGNLSRKSSSSTVSIDRCNKTQFGKDEKPRNNKSVGNLNEIKTAFDSNIPVTPSVRQKCDNNASEEKITPKIQNDSVVSSPKRNNIESDTTTRINSNQQTTQSSEKPANLPKPTSSGKCSAKGLPSVDVKNRSRVVMTYSKDYKFAFIRPVDRSEDFLKFTMKVIKLAKDANYAKELPERDDLILAPFEGNYYRAIVLRNDETENILKVAFLDFGNIENISRDKIKIVNDDILLAPRFSKRVVLKDITVDQKNKKIDNFMEQLANDEVELVIKFDDDEALVELFDAATKESINGKINSLGAAVEKVQKPETDPKAKLNGTDGGADQKFEAHIKKAPANKQLEGENVSVFITDDSQLTSGFVVCFDVKDKQVVAKNELKMEKIAPSLKSSAPYTPVPGELCFVYIKEEDFWFRAECKTVNPANQTIEAHLTDLFKMDIFHFADVRKLPEDFAYPSIMCLCLIDGIGDKITNMAVIKELIRLVPIYEEIKADSIRWDGEKGYSIGTFSFILDKLKSKRLI